MGEGDCMNHTNSALVYEETNRLLLEIADLKEQLSVEKQQHKHWQELAMVFHDALWMELKNTHFSN